VGNNGVALCHAAWECQADLMIVRAAVAQNGMALKYSSTELMEDPNDEIVSAVLHNNWRKLYHAAGGLRADKVTVLTAVTQNGLALQYASKEWRGIREIVLSAVLQNGMALQYASERLRNNYEIVNAAISQNQLASSFALVQLQTYLG